MTYEHNTGMKVFSKLYVGYKPQVVSSAGYDHRSGDYKNPVYGTPLGFATPYEDNAAGRRRQETVDAWAGGNRHSGEPPKIKPTIIDNALAAHFKVTDDIKRVYWGGGNVVFRVEDPRGFELEIQAQNLMTIIRQVGILQGGEIPGKCIWGRDGANNVLIHETSEEYKNARQAAESIKPLKGAAKDTFAPGDTVILTNGEEVRYLGRFWFTKYESHRGDVPAPYVQFVSDKALLKRFDTETTGYTLSEPVQYYAVLVGGLIKLYRDVKIASIKSSTGAALEPQAALDIINSTPIGAASSSISGHFISASEKKTQMVWKKRPLSEGEFQNVLNELRKKDNFNSKLRSFCVYPGYGGKLPVNFTVDDVNGDAWWFTRDDSYSSRQSLHGFETHHMDPELRSRLKGQPDMFYADLVRPDGPNLCVSRITQVRDYWRRDYWRNPVEPRGETKIVPVYEMMPEKDAIAALETWYRRNVLNTFEATYKED